MNTQETEVTIKKDYLKPTLREFGTVHMTTQGTGGPRSGDGRCARNRQVREHPGSC